MSGFLFFGFKYELVMPWRSSSYQELIIPILIFFIFIDIFSKKITKILYIYICMYVCMYEDFFGGYVSAVENSFLMVGFIFSRCRTYQYIRLIWQSNIILSSVEQSSKRIYLIYLYVVDFFIYKDLEKINWFNFIIYAEGQHQPFYWTSQKTLR